MISVKKPILALCLSLFSSLCWAPPADTVSITGFRRPLGYQQLTNAMLQTQVSLTIPALPAGSRGPGFAVIQCQGGVVRWRDDGQGPTATVGMVIPSGGELDYVGQINLIQFISSSGTPICDVSLYE